MTNANKMTNLKALEFILKNYPDIPSDVREKLENMQASLEKKNSSTSRKSSAKQTEITNYRKEIFNYLCSIDEHVTCTQIGQAIPALEGMNNQRISALMRGLTESGRVQKETVKGKSLFYVTADVEKGEDTND